jgi:osmotically inducible lipoprotein OsmB
MKLTPIFLLACILPLTACGMSKEERAATGGMIGAAGGAVAGWTVGAPVTGAVIGAAGGAAVGAMTDPDKVNLGKPFWK